MAFVLENMTALNVFPAIAHRFVQVTVHGFHNDWFPLLIQGNGFIASVKVFVIHLFTCEEIDGGLIAIDPEWFDQVKDEGFFIVIISMQKADIGVEAGENAGLFNKRIKNAITVVETGIEWIFRRPAGSAVETVFFRQYAGQALKVIPTRRSFESH